MSKGSKHCLTGRALADEVSSGAAPRCEGELLGSCTASMGREEAGEPSQWPTGQGGKSALVPKDNQAGRLLANLGGEVTGLGRRGQVSFASTTAWVSPTGHHSCKHPQLRLVSEASPLHPAHSPLHDQRGVSLAKDYMSPSLKQSRSVWKDTFNQARRFKCTRTRKATGQCPAMGPFCKYHHNGVQHTRGHTHSHTLKIRILQTE